MRTLKTWSAEDIIGLVPDELLDNLTDETGVDYSVKKLKGKLIFKLFLFAFLNGYSISLRILEIIYKSERFKNLFNMPVKPVRHSTIGARLYRVDYRYFEKIFEHLVRSSQLETVSFNRKRISISKIDTTLVLVSNKLLSVGLNDNPGYKTLKFGVELRDSVPVNVMLFENQRELSEDNALPKLILEQKRKKALNIAIFDRGIQRKQNFIDFHKQGVKFISRLSTQKVAVVKTLDLETTETPTLKIVADQIIRFSSDENIRPDDAGVNFRMITGRNKSTNQTIRFLANVDWLSAAEVANLYKSRWEIETFFKFIKQELNFSHILSRSANGVKVVMYLTMISAILLTLYKKLNKIIGWTVAKIKFVDELYVGVREEWKQELSAGFAPANTVFNLNSS